MRTASTRVVSVVALAAVATCVAIVGCATDRDVPAVTGPRHAGGGETPSAEERLAFKARLQAARVRVRPIIAFHHEVMVDVRENQKAYLAGPGTLQERLCRVPQRIADKHLGKLRFRNGRAWTDAERQGAVRVGRQTLRHCDVTIQGNLFARSASLTVASRAVREGVGPYLSIYTDLIDQTIGAWDGYTDLLADIDAAIYNMPIQYPLTDVDMGILAGQIEMAETSLADAENMQLSDDPAWEYEVGSIFATSSRRWPGKTLLKKIASVVVADVAGFLGGAYGYAATHEDPDEDGQNAVWAGVGTAATASGAMITACLNDNTPCKAQTGS